MRLNIWDHNYRSSVSVTDTAQDVSGRECEEGFGRRANMTSFRNLNLLEDSRAWIQIANTAF